MSEPGSKWRDRIFRAMFGQGPVTLEPVTLEKVSPVKVYPVGELLSAGEIDAVGKQAAAEVEQRRRQISVTVSREPDERIVNCGEHGDFALPPRKPYPDSLVLVYSRHDGRGCKVVFGRGHSTVTFEWEGDGAGSPTLHELRRAAANYIGE